MRIRVVFNQSRTSIHLPVVFHGQGRSRFILFLVDTGSEMSSLSYGDAKGLGIDYSVLGKSKKSSITYAGEVRPYRLDSGRFDMVAEDGKTVTEHLRSIDVLESTRNEKLDASLPSAVGMDFLNEFSYSLYVCPKKNEAFLEKC